MNRQRSAIKRRELMLILLCWIIYTASYVGKLNYAANINLIMNYYGVSHADAGLVSTAFFFSYGIGQVLNGILCKKYNIKLSVTLGIVLSSVSNLLIAITDSFTLIAPLWLVNGFSLSLLWPCIIRLLSESVDISAMPFASIVMGTTTAVGTFIIYGTSAALALVTDFSASFILASAVMIICCVIWLLFYDRLAGVPDAPKISVTKEDRLFDTSQSRTIYLNVCMLAICGVATNFIKDGLTTWVPSILKENYLTTDSLSILLTLALPIVTIFSNAFAVKIHKHVPEFLLQCTLIFSIAGAIMLPVMFTLTGKSFILPLILFAAVCFLVGSNNSLITSVFPLFMKGKANSGAIAGILNGFCYVGSALSSYTLGLVADAHGWMGVFILLCITAFSALSLLPAYFLLKTKLRTTPRDKTQGVR